MQGQDLTGGFAQAPLGAVAVHRPADLAGGGEAGADRGGLVAAVQGLDHDGAPGAGRALGGRQELRPGLQTFDGRRLRHGSRIPREQKV